MINVDRRADLAGFGPWTSKAEGVSVQPPQAILAKHCTIRIHLDDCDADNGALHVVPGTHQRGVVLPEDVAQAHAQSMDCEVPAGGVMLMRPLLLHASNRSTSNQPRRVLHLEFPRHRNCPPACSGANGGLRVGKVKLNKLHFNNADFARPKY